MLVHANLKIKRGLLFTYNVSRLTTCSQKWYYEGKKIAYDCIKTSPKLDALGGKCKVSKLYEYVLLFVDFPCPFIKVKIKINTFKT